MGLPPPSSPSGLGLPPCYRAPQLQASTESADPTGTRGAPPSRSSSSPSSPSCSRPGPPVQKLSSRLAESYFRSAPSSVESQNHWYCFLFSTRFSHKIH